ncbi:MAG TPA: hypothetical protein PL110_01105 [Candidatus Eremiobacteraeota bacterium]|nr:MAG: hypothetical protein BWY64_02727 [bacterium ADurb.Bin363]HPZ06684.1 hypothetical protein [Candidatus Eremiobacteraeota bacterium]
MTYKDLYTSFNNDLTILENKAKVNKTFHNSLLLVKTKLSYYEKEMREMEILEKTEEGLNRYMTTDYQRIISEIRRKVIYRLNVLIKLAAEIENLFSNVNEFNKHF